MTTVTDYEVFELPPRLVCLRVETDDGLVGWGEPTLGAHSNIVETAVEILMDAFVMGEDPLGRQDQHYDLRVYAFLGGRVRNWIRVCTTVCEQFVERTRRGIPKSGPSTCANSVSRPPRSTHSCEFGTSNLRRCPFTRPSRYPFPQLPT